MPDDQTKAALARLRAERRALAAAKKAVLADIREARVRHRWNALVAGGWRTGSVQRAAFEAAMAADRARLAAALAPHEAAVAR